MNVFIYLFNLALDIYIGIIVIQVAVSWLIGFDVINATNKQAKKLIQLLARATDPIYKPIQKYIPPIGGLDLTPLIVLILISFLRAVIVGGLVTLAA